MTLEAELEQYRRQISTDAYPMSIGEVANLYRDGELEIHPEFQRLFRWTPVQQTRLIESILLGIPLPSIFVAAGESGWDVVDGVQRLSTIFHFMGILRNEEAELLPPFRCEEAPFLKSLNGMLYEPDGDSLGLSQTQRIDFKRARLDMKIIKRESDKRAKYDLFQRLNSYGTVASEQELRNSLLVSISREHYRWLVELSENQDFLATLNLPEKLIRERYHMEIALRFITLRQVSEDRLKGLGFLGEFLTAEIVPLTELSAEEMNAEKVIFERTFSLLERAAGSDVFRKWNPVSERPIGAFSVTAFEVLALGIGYHDAPSRITPELIMGKRRDLWSDAAFSPGFATGIRADHRMKTTIPRGRQLFS